MNSNNEKLVLSMILIGLLLLAYMMGKIIYALMPIQDNEIFATEIKIDAPEFSKIKNTITVFSIHQNDTIISDSIKYFYKRTNRAKIISNDELKKCINYYTNIKIYKNEHNYAVVCDMTTHYKKSERQTLVEKSRIKIKLNKNFKIYCCYYINPEGQESIN